MSPSVDITVVICSYNRADILRLALEALVTQETEDAFTYEVVVVDDASTDHTRDVVEACIASAAPLVRYERADGEGVAAARNRGIEVSSSPWIAYTDDDQINDPQWLIELFRTAEQQDADCVGGGVELRLEREPAVPLTEVTSGVLGQKRNPEGRITRLMACPGTGNVMFRRTVFDRVGCFDNGLRWGGEDAELMVRVMQAEIPVWFNPRSIVHHLIPPYRTEEAYFRWASLRVGVALAEVDRRTKGKGKLAVLCVARLAQAALKNLPRYMIARLAGDQGKVLETKCLLWRVGTYTRGTLYLLAPALFPQQAFFESLTFRVERSEVAKDAS